MCLLLFLPEIGVMKLASILRAKVFFIPKIRGSLNIFFKKLSTSKRLFGEPILSKTTACDLMENPFLIVRLKILSDNKLQKLIKVN